MVVFGLFISESLSVHNIISELNSKSLRLPPELVNYYTNVFRENVDYKSMASKHLARNMVFDLHPTHPGLDVTLAGSFLVSYLLVCIENDESIVRAFLTLNLQNEEVSENANLSTYVLIIDKRFPIKEIKKKTLLQSFSQLINTGIP